MSLCSWGNPCHGNRLRVQSKVTSVTFGTNSLTSEPSCTAETKGNSVYTSCPSQPGLKYPGKLQAAAQDESAFPGSLWLLLSPPGRATQHGGTGHRGVPR